MIRGGEQGGQPERRIGWIHVVEVFGRGAVIAVVRSQQYPMYDPTMTPPQTREELGSYVVLYGFFAGIGALPLMVFLLVVIWPQWRVNTLFVESEGTVVDQRDSSNEGGTFRRVRLRYSVQGADVEHWNSSVTWPAGPEEPLQNRIRALAIGERCPVWYDPASPEVVVIERGYWIHWMLYPIVIGCGFFLLYSVGKIIVGVRRFAASKLKSACAQD